MGACSGTRLDTDPCSVTHSIQPCPAPTERRGSSSLICLSYPQSGLSNPASSDLSDLVYIDFADADCYVLHASNPDAIIRHAFTTYH
ncbi:unnamed protein product [Somion occarium]|uniref:Uncharacterized protein n=1 Tax=Somion occarium TaxID=3059160 RepID=A0ABP1DWT1_9APHY